MAVQRSHGQKKRNRRWQPVSLARTKNIAYVSVPRFSDPSPGSGTRASCSASASPKFLRGTPSAPGGSGSVLTARATSSSVICVLDLSQTFASNHLTKKRKKRHSKGLQLSGHRRKVSLVVHDPKCARMRACVVQRLLKGRQCAFGKPQRQQARCIPLLLLEQRGRELEEFLHAAQLLYSQACFRHDS
jgi:hypothetical protein